MPSKKKKPAANPARGFATTSIAKKVQPVAEQETTLKETHDAAHVTKLPPSGQQAGDVEAAGESKQDDQRPELHELSPEELEKHLEQDELQLLVEKYGPQTQRAIDRQVGKLSTDYRLLRGHASHLGVRSMVSEDLILKLVDLVREDLDDAINTASSARITLQQEEIAARLWSLQGALKALGFRDEHIARALAYALKLQPPVDKENPVWALDECLDWLVLHTSDEDLPRYDQHTGKAQIEVQDQFNATAVDVSGSAEKEVKAKKSASSSSSAGVTAPTTAAPSDEEDDIVISDLDSDLEPDELLFTHLAAREKLYELQPELFMINGKSKAKPGSNSSTSSTVKRLQTKLQKIEADVLFDQREADAQWTMRRNQIAQDVSQRRRMQLPDRSGMNSNKESKSKAQTTKQPASASSTSSEESDSDEEDTAFADLFGAEAPGEISTSAASDAVLHDRTITITNFGQVQGLSPWRVLEETCRARWISLPH